MINRNALKPLQTLYKGFRFRSRLEARWAVFFDALRIEWEYEPEGFELLDGTCYLPDFWLPHVGEGAFVEIKPQRPTREEQEKCQQLALGTGNRVICFPGLPGFWLDSEPPMDGGQLFDSYAHGASVMPGWDNCYTPCVCPKCDRAGIEFDGRGGRVCGNKCTDDDKAYSSDHPLVVSAIAIARTTRFWDPKPSRKTRLAAQWSTS